MWFVINETGLVTNVNYGLTGRCSVSDRVGQYWIRDDVTEAGKSDVKLHHGAATTRWSLLWAQYSARNRTTSHVDISRNYTTTAPSIATVQYITHDLSTIMTKSGAMYSLRLTYSHLRRGTKYKHLWRLHRLLDFRLRLPTKRSGNRISTVGPFLGCLNLHTKFPGHHKSITACEKWST